MRLGADRGVQAEQLHALEIALGNPGEGTRGWEFQQPRDAQFSHGGQAEVPAHRVGHLLDESLQVVGAGRDDLPVRIGEEPGTGVVGGDGPGQALQMSHRRLHVDGVESPSHAELNQPRSSWWVGLQVGELLHRPGGDDLAGAIVVGRSQASGVNRGQHLFGVPADDSHHRGRSRRRSDRHLLPPFADEHHGLLGAQHAGGGCGGDLADAVAAHDCDLLQGLRGVGEEFQS